MCVCVPVVNELPKLAEMSTKGRRPKLVPGWVVVGDFGQEDDDKVKQDEESMDDILQRRLRMIDPEGKSVL